MSTPSFLWISNLKALNGSKYDILQSFRLFHLALKPTMSSSSFQLPSFYRRQSHQRRSKVLKSYEYVGQYQQRYEQHFQLRRNLKENIIIVIIIEEAGQQHSLLTLHCPPQLLHLQNAKLAVLSGTIMHFFPDTFTIRHPSQLVNRCLYCFRYGQEIHSAFLSVNQRQLQNFSHCAVLSRKYSMSQVF